MRMFCPTIKTGCNTEELGLSVDLTESCIKIVYLVRTDNHCPHKFDNIPLTAGNKPDTATTPYRPGIGKYHHSGNGCGQRIPIFVRYRWPHLILEKKGILHSSTFKESRTSSL